MRKSSFVLEIWTFENLLGHGTHFSKNKLQKKTFFSMTCCGHKQHWPYVIDWLIAYRVPNPSISFWHHFIPIISYEIDASGFGSQLWSHLHPFSSQRARYTRCFRDSAKASSRKHLVYLIYHTYGVMDSLYLISLFFNTPFNFCFQSEIEKK